MEKLKQEQQEDYPLAHTEATKMLAAALERTQAERDVTQRDIAKELNYKSSVVLSHMALGRVPIPIDKVNLIARTLKLDPSRLLIATLKQRHPDIAFEALMGVRLPDESALSAELELIAERPLDQIAEPTKQILREVAGTMHPERRWLSLAELPVMEMLRQRYPTLRTDGLPADDRRRLVNCLGEKPGAEL